jgi:hypothetical protein
MSIAFAGLIGERPVVIGPVIVGLGPIVDITWLAESYGLIFESRTESDGLGLLVLLLYNIDYIAYSIDSFRRLDIACDCSGSTSSIRSSMSASLSLPSLS